MVRRPLIVANWKMNKRLSETEEFCAHLRAEFPKLQRAEVAVAPPYTSLAAAARVLKGSSIKLAAQNVFWADWGAFTGEISPPMLLDVGCHFALVGHSERRQFFGENDESVNKKVQALLKVGIIPILCVGETLPERERGEALSIVEKQVRNGLAGVEIKNPQDLVIAYEPVWAIGTGKTATPQQAQEMHAFIRRLLNELFSFRIGEGLRIIYGGSVKPENIFAIISQEDVDGALVGGASLEINTFIQIIKACLDKKNS